MVEYVIVYAEAMKHFNDGAPPQFVLTLKDRPEWQAGHLNLPGGRIEPGETPENAAIRELREETGLRPIEASRVEVMGTIQGHTARVYCVKAITIRGPIKPAEGETEVSHWTNGWDIRENKLLMPNLKVIIPLMQYGIKGWTIEDQAPKWEEKNHTFTITVPMKFWEVMNG